MVMEPELPNSFANTATDGHFRLLEILPRDCKPPWLRKTVKFQLCGAGPRLVPLLWSFIEIGHPMATIVRLNFSQRGEKTRQFSKMTLASFGCG